MCQKATEVARGKHTLCAKPQCFTDTSMQHGYLALPQCATHHHIHRILQPKSLCNSGPCDRHLLLYAVPPVRVLRKQQKSNGPEHVYRHIGEACPQQCQQRVRVLLLWHLRLTMSRFDHALSTCLIPNIYGALGTSQKPWSLGKGNGYGWE